MPFVPVANTVLVEFRMLYDSQNVENTIYVEFASNPTPETMTALGNDLLAWWIANIAPIVSTGIILREIVVTNLTSDSSAQVSVVPATTTIGELGDSSLPSNVSLTVSFRTAQRGRSFRGRNYVVGLVESQTTGINTLPSTTTDQFVAAYNELPTTVAGQDGVWVVVSRFSGVDGDGKPIPRAAGVTTPITTVLVVDQVVDSQRRRLPGRGR